MPSSFVFPAGSQPGVEKIISLLLKMTELRRGKSQGPRRVGSRAVKSTGKAHPEGAGAIWGGGWGFAGLREVEGCQPVQGKGRRATDVVQTADRAHVQKPRGQMESTLS